MEDPEWLSNVLQEIVNVNEELNALEEDAGEISEISKRSVESPQNTSLSSGMPVECRREVWQCMSGVMEAGLRLVERPEDIYTGLQPLLYKAVFHGGVKTMWSSVMEVTRAICKYQVRLRGKYDRFKILNGVLGRIHVFHNKMKANLTNADLITSFITE